jgi:predicted RNA-binding Zn ribbon-like protein
MATDFRLGLGHIALDFTATVGGRSSTAVERLASADDLSRWLRAAGLADAPAVGDDELAKARELREAIWRVLDRARAGARLPSREAALVNEWARERTATAQIGPGFKRTSLGPDPATAALARIARETVELVTGPDLARVRTCAGCSLLFLDRSPPGRRRWCSMERCGNREKTARYRKKAHG